MGQHGTVPLKASYSNGLCWAATDDDGLVGLAYAAFDPESYEWEIGGLMVLERARGKGIGTILMLLALGHALISEDPPAWDRPPKIVAHVHKRNDMPRRIIVDGLKFHHSASVKIPGDRLEGLPVEEDGCVHGDEFSLIVPDTLYALADFCDSWNDVVRSGELL